MKHESVLGLSMIKNDELPVWINVLSNEQTDQENEYLFNAETIIDFLETLTVYFLESDELSDADNLEKEKEVYAFNFREYISTSLN